MRLSTIPYASGWKLYSTCLAVRGQDDCEACKINKPLPADDMAFAYCRDNCRSANQLQLEPS
jgi:hypothetical protein